VRFSDTKWTGNRIKKEGSFVGEHAYTNPNSNPGDYVDGSSEDLFSFASYRGDRPRNDPPNAVPSAAAQPTSQPQSQPQAPSNWVRCRMCNTSEHAFGRGTKCKPVMESMVADGFCSRCRAKVGHTFIDCPFRDNSSRYSVLGRGGLGDRRGWVVPEEAVVGSPGPGMSPVSATSPPPPSLSQPHLGQALAGVRQEKIFYEIALLGTGGGFEALQEECIRMKGAVLDEGSSGTVGGEDWLIGYEKSVGKSLVREEANASYTFGVGNKRVMFSVLVPFQVGKLRFLLRADIVPGCLPLLLSRKAQIGMGAVVDHGAGTLTAKKKGESAMVRLVGSTTGHWLVPLE
jgi:hypothetical protein